ncbi:MBL fold metallo-hydrolase [Nocardia sp. NPDC003482]
MTRIRTQPDDWTEPGPHQIVRGVHRIPLPLPIDGLAAVNAYLLEGADGLILIDPGWACPQTERAVAAALELLGYALGDIAVCLATHHHADHYTQACAWRKTLGCKLFTGREERHSIDAFPLPGGFPHHSPLLAHHRHRLDEVCERVAAGATTAYDIAAALPSTRRGLRLDDLPPEHQLSAIMEIDAHLDVLSMQGRVGHDDGATVRRFALAA